MRIKSKWHLEQTKVKLVSRLKSFQIWMVWNGHKYISNKPFTEFFVCNTVFWKDFNNHKLCLWWMVFKQIGTIIIESLNGTLVLGFDRGMQHNWGIKRLWCMIRLWVQMNSTVHIDSCQMSHVTWEIFQNSFKPYQCGWKSLGHKLADRGSKIYFHRISQYLSTCTRWADLPRGSPKFSDLLAFCQSLESKEMHFFLF